MDYNIKAEVLAVMLKNSGTLVEIGYLPEEYFEIMDDALIFAATVYQGWGSVLKDGEQVLDQAWELLCKLKHIDPAVKVLGYEDFLAMSKAE